MTKSAGQQFESVRRHHSTHSVAVHHHQIELDIIIKNGILVIVEIKSSMIKPEMYIFERKVRFYEEHHNRKASEMIVISPMVAPNAIPIAEKLGIRIYSYADKVKL